MRRNNQLVYIYRSEVEDLNDTGYFKKVLKCMGIEYIERQLKHTV